MFINQSPSINSTVYPFIFMDCYIVPATINFFNLINHDEFVSILSAEYRRLLDLRQKHSSLLYQTQIVELNAFLSVLDHASPEISKLYLEIFKMLIKCSPQDNNILNFYIVNRIENRLLIIETLNNAIGEKPLLDANDSTVVSIVRITKGSFETGNGIYDVLTGLTEDSHPLLISFAIERVHCLHNDLIISLFVASDIQYALNICQVTYDAFKLTDVYLDSPQYLKDILSFNISNLKTSNSGGESIS